MASLAAPLVIWRFVWCEIEQRNAAATVAASPSKAAPASERAHAPSSHDELPRHSSDSVLSVPSSSTSFGSLKNVRPFPPLSFSPSMVGASTSSAGSLDKAHEEMMDFLESCGLAHMKGVFHLTNDDNSSSEDASSTVLESGDARSRVSSDTTRGLDSSNPNTHMLSRKVFEKFWTHFYSVIAIQGFMV